MKNPKKLEYLRSLQVLFFDEAGQVSDEMFAVIDIIFRRIKDSNIFMGGVLIIMSLDHSQLLPIEGRPFLTSVHVIPCIKMVCLQHSIRANEDAQLQRIQEIARMNYRKFSEYPELVDEFVRLCSDSFTFVDSWDDPKITMSTMRLYSKRVPARDASKEFVNRVRRRVEVGSRIERNAEDVMKNRYSHQDWRSASENVSTKLDQHLKEPQLLLFFKGAIYETTFNNKNKFSNTQMVMMYDIPSTEAVLNWRKVKVLKYPLGEMEVEYDPNLSKQAYLDQGFVEVDIGIAPERTQYLAGNIQAKRKQYGLKHRLASTIHEAMGDTLPSVATEVSFSNSNFSMWDKGQMIVITSRTKLGKDTIFVSNKDDTLKALKSLLTRKTQWTDYMEDVLDIITVNSSVNQNEHQVESNRTFTQTSFPYRICDVSLPDCNTGYVYMLVSIKDSSFAYIGKTNSIRTRITQHNTGIGSTSTEPIHLRPFALYAYICGFNGNQDLMFYVERQWKEKRNRLIRNGVNDINAWARCGSEVIACMRTDVEAFGILPSELSLICVFNDS